MNKRETKIIERALNLIEAVPRSGGAGSNSASIKGFVDYHDDMTKVVSATSKAIRMLLYPHGYDSDDIRDIERQLAETEEYITKRRESGWR